MSKLHSRKKGKSGSRRPKSAASAKHVEMPKEQIEELILKMVKEETKSETFDEAIQKIIAKTKSQQKSYFGKFKGLGEFKREEIDRFA